ncbi:MAG: DASH family cryptochrome [Cyanobacteria bacterium J06554_3]
MRILVWLRNDLRLHDHEPLHRALEAKNGQSAEVIPLYCFDPSHFGETSFGFAKTGAYRAQFLLETIADLRQSLRSRGSDLVIRRGKPDEEIATLVKELNIDAVYWHEEVTSEETTVERNVEKALSELKVSSEVYWGATLYHPDDLPFEMKKLPEVFTQFRKSVEKESQVFPTFPVPEQLPTLPEGIVVGELPTLSNLGLESQQIDARGVLAFKGGETAALERLQHYFWDADRLQVYKETRNGMLGADYSSKFSPWLANGSLSPRKVYEEVQKYERERKKNNSTYWMIFELIWRDYFRFVCVKYGRKIFRKGGIRGLPIDWKEDWKRFDLWREGETGYPLIDANMKELAATGFMSNRGRQNVASFLTKNLGIDWQMGAEWFESVLLDYDVCSNWGNWNYTAGVGNDARGFRYFNIPKQSKDYDPNGDYVKHWLPALSELPAKKVHGPWKLQPVEQKRFNVRLGVDYPNPVVDLQKSVAVNEQRYQDAWGKKSSKRR